MRIAFCCERVSGSNLLLRPALEELGHQVEVITAPGDLDGDYDFAVYRWTPQGRLPASFDAALVLAGAGVTFVNRPDVILRCLSKPVTHHALAAAGLLYPRSWSIYHDRDIPDELPPGRCIIKPYDGAMGRDVRVVRGRRKILRELRRRSGPVVLQEFIQPVYAWRVLAGRETTLGIYRRSPGPHQEIISLHRGAIIRDCSHDGARELACQMIRAVDGDLLAVDILEDEEGRLWALEVNGNFGFRPFGPQMPATLAAELVRLGSNAQKGHP